MKLKKILTRLFIIFSSIILLVIGTFLYAKFEYRNIKETKLQMETTKEIPDLKIVYLADFQYDLGWRDEYLQEDLFEEVIQKVNKQNPDVILLGGDYLNFAVHTNRVSELLSNLKAKFGKYGVLGNHDYAAKRNNDLVETFEENGIIILENEKIEVADLVICGVADLWMGNPQLNQCEGNEEKINILLTHNPDYFEELSNSEKKQFDLTLAGHLHAGQITFFGLFAFPGILPSDYGEKFRYGLKQYDDSYIYVTSGLGGSVMTEPLRFGAQPEIVIIDIKKSTKNIIKKG